MSGIRIRAASRMRRMAAASLGVAALAFVPTIASVGQTEAAWVNSEHATTTVGAGVVLPASPGTACTVNGLGVTTYHWALPASGGLARGGFAIGLYQNGQLVAERIDIAATASSATVTSLLGSLVGGTYQVRLQAYLQGQPTWRSAPLYGTLTVGALGLNPNCGNVPLSTTP